MSEDADAVIANLVSSDDAIVPTLRSVLDRQWEDRLATSLDMFCSLKER